MNAEKSAEAMMVAAEAVLTETRETIEARTVSALQQAHEMSHRPGTTAESFFQARRSQHTVRQQVQKWTESENSVIGYACVVTLHDYTTDTNDDMTTDTVFHTEHINTNTWVYMCVVLFIFLCHRIVRHCTCTA